MDKDCFRSSKVLIYSYQSSDPTFDPSFTSTLFIPRSTINNKMWKYMLSQSELSFHTRRTGTKAQRSELNSWHFTFYFNPK